MIEVEKGGRRTYSTKDTLRGLAVEMRPQQWVKNLAVLAPLLFSLNLLHAVPVAYAIVAFIAFCLVSSSIYILNDICDREQDRLHPEKRNRPIAAGLVGSGAAWGAMGALGAMAVGVSWLIGPAFTIVIVSFWALNLLYSLWLKHQVILDVFAIAAGFLLRVIGGAIAIDVFMTDWLLLCTTLLALFLGFSKRRHELLSLGDAAGPHRRVLGDYTPALLDMMIGIVGAATVISYALYTVSPETVAKFHTRGLLLTFPFVLFGVFRYLYLVYLKDLGGDPTYALIHDRAMIVDIALWVVTAAAVLYSS